MITHTVTVCCHAHCFCFVGLLSALTRHNFWLLKMDIEPGLKQYTLLVPMLTAKIVTRY